MGLALFWFGLRLIGTGTSPDQIRTIATWSLAGLTLLGLLGTYEGMLHVLGGSPPQQAFHEVLIDGAVGSLAGALLGYSSVRQTGRVRHLAG